MNTVPNRMVVYTKDVVNITGRRERTARKLLARIRKACGKQKGHFISVEEFCSFTGLKPEHVTPFLL